MNGQLVTHDLERVTHGRASTPLEHAATCSATTPILPIVVDRAASLLDAHGNTPAKIRTRPDVRELVKPRCSNALFAARSVALPTVLTRRLISSENRVAVSRGVTRRARPPLNHPYNRAKRLKP